MYSDISVCRKTQKKQQFSFHKKNPRNSVVRQDNEGEIKHCIKQAPTLFSVQMGPTGKSKTKSKWKPVIQYTVGKMTSAVMFPSIQVVQPILQDH